MYVVSLTYKVPEEIVDFHLPAHVEAVRSLFLDALSEDDVADLARIGEKIVGRLDKDHWILRESKQA